MRLSSGGAIANVSDNCLNGANAPRRGFAQSQRDLNADGFSDTGDIAQFTGQFGRAGGAPGLTPGYEGRLDLNYDAFIDTGDIAQETAVFGRSC